MARARNWVLRRISPGPREFTRRVPFALIGRSTASGPGGCASATPGSTVFQEDSISVEPRINDRIRVPEVRLVGAEGEQIGIVAIGEALRLAQEADLDLVEVAPDARPPVCKLMDYGKFKYESAQKAREARRNQVLTVIKEMKLRPKIDCARLRDQEGSRRSLPQRRGQGQGHHHVPRSGAVPPRTRVPAAAAAVRRCCRAGVRGERAQAGRPQHDHGPGPAQEARPAAPAAAAGSGRPDRHGE